MKVRTYGLLLVLVLIAISGWYMQLKVISIALENGGAVLLNLDFNSMEEMYIEYYMFLIFAILPGFIFIFILVDERKGLYKKYRKKDFL